MFISYIVMGTVCELSCYTWICRSSSPGFGVMLALGEMSTKYPSKKGFAGHATRCVDPAFGFATALIYLCKVSLANAPTISSHQYLIISPNQIIASSLVLRYWNTSINGGVFVTIFILFVRTADVTRVTTHARSSRSTASASSGSAKSSIGAVLSRSSPSPA